VATKTEYDAGSSKRSEGIFSWGFAGFGRDAGASASQMRDRNSKPQRDRFLLFGRRRGTAAYKVRLSVEEWQKKTGVKKVKIGKIKTSCGDWFIKYGLPHKTCVAKARVCW
jgi:hypothetical protein